MPDQATITYLDHSGFCCSIGGHLMIFDYYNDEAARRELTQGVITRAELKKYDRVSVFISHSHSDHFNPVVYGWADSVPVEYYISHELPEGCEGYRLKPGDSVERNGMRIQAFDSTDLGVAFLVEYEGIVIFHAGDLNWWHWREESSPVEIEQAEKDFKDIMETVLAAVKKTPLDIGFFPLDPRQRSYYDAGASYFVMAAKPRLMIPMHFMGRGEVVRDFARRNQTRTTRIQPMIARGEQYVYTQEPPEEGYRIYDGGGN